MKKALVVSVFSLFLFSSCGTYTATGAYTELVAAGLTNGKELVKVLGNGELKAKIDVEANAFSKTAEDAIKAVGGNATKI